jgi:hypothetical protein
VGHNISSVQYETRNRFRRNIKPLRHFHFGCCNDGAVTELQGQIGLKTAQGSLIGTTDSGISVGFNRLKIGANNWFSATAKYQEGTSGPRNNWGEQQIQRENLTPRVSLVSQPSCQEQ